MCRSASKDLEDRDLQIKLINDRLNKIEDELKSEAHSDEESQNDDEQSDQKYDDKYGDNDQTSLHEQSKEQSEVTPSERASPTDKYSYRMIDKDQSKATVGMHDSKKQFTVDTSKQQMATNDSSELIGRHESKAYIHINQSKESIHDSKKRPAHLVSQSHVFETSEKSTYNWDLRDSNDRPFGLELNAHSKRTLLRQYDSKNINSKLSFEAPLTTKESSTSTLINKLRINPGKNKSK